MDVGGSGNSCITGLVDRGAIESHRYYRARRTAFEMLRDRGYDVPDIELTRSLSEFRAVFGSNPDLEHLRICVSLLSCPSKKEGRLQILLIFCGTERMKKQDIIGILGQINKNCLHRVMLILQSQMNCYAKEIVDAFPIEVETFQITDLLVNVTKHVLGPKHDIFTAKEKQKLLKKYKIQDKQIPRMLENDAMARYYGLKKGDVVKVTYGGGPTDSLVTYRRVM